MKAEAATGLPARRRPHIVLHGYGATPADIASIGSIVDPGQRYATTAPEAPIAAGTGYSWYHFDNAT